MLAVDYMVVAVVTCPPVGVSLSLISYSVNLFILNRVGVQKTSCSLIITNIPQD